MREQEKHRQRIYDLLITESKPKRFFEIIGRSLWPSLIPDHNPLDYPIWGVLENKTNQLPIEILIRLTLLLRRNGIKDLKNLF